MWQVTGARIFLHFCCCCFYPEFFGIAATIRTHQKIRFYMYAGFLGNNHSIQSCLKPWLYTLGCINTAFKPNPVCFAPEPVVFKPSSLFQSLKTVDCWDAQALPHLFRQRLSVLLTYLYCTTGFIYFNTVLLALYLYYWRTGCIYCNTVLLAWFTLILSYWLYLL